MLKFSLNVSFAVFVLAGCGTNNDNKMAREETYPKGTYGYDADFLRKHLTDVIELHNGDARVFLSGGDQGRVMTSSASGNNGAGYGWINYELIESGKRKPQFNPIGGEERLWLGPEGGQFSLYFKKADSFSIKNWLVPPVIDTEKFDVTQSDSLSATFSKKSMLTNYSGFVFQFQLIREVELLNKALTEKALGIEIPAEIKFVAYQTNNRLINAGDNIWRKESGLLSIWLLSMMNPTEETKVIIPFYPKPNAKSFITSNYFGEISSDRLLIKDSVLFFRCDGKSRGKLGIAPEIAKPVVGSFDFKNNVLTILKPEVHPDRNYVNSKWEIQKQPYKGDVINSYNDGPLEDGSQLGPFYEIESSSPAIELKPGESERYHQAIIHLTGNYPELKELAKQLLQVNLDEVKNW